MRGAAFLCQVTDAVVVDIGGTTTDVGVLRNRFPREASTDVRVGGVRTNFRMPDVHSVGLGGGSYVRKTAEGRTTVGPFSAGYNLMKVRKRVACVVHVPVLGGEWGDLSVFGMIAVHFLYCAVSVLCIVYTVLCMSCALSILCCVCAVHCLYCAVSVLCIVYTVLWLSCALSILCCVCAVRCLFCAVSVLCIVYSVPCLCCAPSVLCCVCAVHCLCCAVSVLYCVCGVSMLCCSVTQLCCDCVVGCVCVVSILRSVYEPVLT